MLLFPFLLAFLNPRRWLRRAVPGWWALSLLALTMSALPAAANHLVGYDWQMQSVGNNLYRLRLTVYLDAVNGGPEANGDPSVTLITYARQVPAGTVPSPISTFVLPRTNLSSLPGAGSNCVGIDIPTRVLTYESIVELPPLLYSTPGGHYAVWERCCRNGLITNLDRPIEAGLVAILGFPTLRANGTTLTNSRPQFTAVPRGAAYCVGEPLDLSFAATDADGDSLSYELTSALLGGTTTGNPISNLPSPAPYRLATYTSSYSAARPLPGTFTLNPRTGALRGVAGALGTFEVVVRCLEWRQGVLIGENRREIQVSIANCVANHDPSLTALNFNPADTLVVSGATDRCLSLRLFDPDFGQTVGVRLLGGNGAVSLQPTGYTVPYPAAPADLQLCWTDCSVPAIVPLTLVATDDGCLPSRPDTLRLIVRVVPEPNTPPTLSRLPPGTDTLRVVAGEELTFGVQAQDADNDPLLVTVQAKGMPGVVAEPLQGIGNVLTAVRWRPACEAMRATPYHLRFAVSDGGCRPTDSLNVVVRVVAAPELVPAGTLLPNVITPNADGLNDCFSLGIVPGSGTACGGIAAFGGVQIFNRWGKMVYEAADPRFCWDAAGLSAGTYYYLARLPAGRTIRGLVAVEKEK